MRTHRGTAAIVGVLYFLGTLFGVLSVITTSELRSGRDFLIKIANNQNQLTLGAFFILLMGISLAAMPIFLYPIFKRKNEALALGMLIFRGPIEATTYIVAVLSWLILGEFSTQVVNSGLENQTVELLSKLLLKISDINGPILSIIFIIGALFLYSLFCSTRLIPRWLTWWGIIGSILYLGVYIIKFFSLPLELDLLLIPLALQEMVMAFWLIFKGFNREKLDKLLYTEK